MWLLTAADRIPAPNVYWLLSKPIKKLFEYKNDQEKLIGKFIHLIIITFNVKFYKKKKKRKFTHY